MNFLGYEAIMLAFEANGVIGLRLMKIASGGVDAGREVILMVQEKAEAAVEAQTTLMGGGMSNRFQSRPHFAANTAPLAA